MFEWREGGDCVRYPLVAVELVRILSENGRIEERRSGVALRMETFNEGEESYNLIDLRISRMG